MNETEPIPLLACALQVAEIIDAKPVPPARWPRIRFGDREPIHPLVRRAIFDRDGHRCVSCGIPLTIREAQLDHIIPWSAGGSDWSENLRTLCQPCNAERSNFRSDLDWWTATRPAVTFECVHCVIGDECDPDDDDVVAASLAATERAYCFRCGLVSAAWEVY